MAPLWENCGPGGTIMETLLILLILPFVSTKTPGGCLSPASSSAFARDALSSQKPIYHLWERDHPSLYLSRLEGRPTTGVRGSYKQAFCNTNGRSAARFIGGSGVTMCAYKVSYRLSVLIGIPRMSFNAKCRSHFDRSAVCVIVALVIHCHSSVPSVLEMNHQPPPATLLAWSSKPASYGCIGAPSFRGCKKSVTDCHQYQL